MVDELPPTPVPPMVDELPPTPVPPDPPDMIDELPPVPAPEPIKYYGLFTVDGKAQGFWNSDLFPPKEDGSRNDKIPPEAVEITEAQWREIVPNQMTVRFANGEITYPLSAQPLGQAEYNWGLPLAFIIGTPQ